VPLLRRIAFVVPALLLLVAADVAAAQANRRNPGATAPVEAVEQFLQLGRQKRYLDMGWLFGTSEGPVLNRDPQGDVERRMYALASVLESDTHAVLSEEPIPGSIGSQVRLVVQIRQRGQQFRVPFTTVRGPDGRWFVEIIGVEAVTNPPSSS
jgi:hypothetical protein